MTQTNPFADLHEEPPDVPESEATEPETVAAEQPSPEDDEANRPMTPDEALAAFDSGAWDRYDEGCEELVIASGGWPFTESWFELSDSAGAEGNKYLWQYGRSGSATAVLASGVEADRKAALAAMRTSFGEAMRDGSLKANL